MHQCIIEAKILLILLELVRICKNHDIFGFCCVFLSYMKYVMQNLFENENLSRQALEVSKEGFKSYFENGPVAMCVNSPENKWMEINQEFCRLMGYEKEELLSMDWSKITHPDDIQSNKELVLKVKNGELDHFKLDKRYIRKDGRIIYATLSLVAARNPDGSINHMIASFIDNTEHHQAVEDLILEQHNLRSLVNVSPDGIVVTDVSGHLEFVSNKIYQILGIPESNNLIGNLIFDWIEPEDLSFAKQSFQNVLNNDIQAPSQTYKCRRYDGSTFWGESSSTLLEDKNGAIRGLMIVFRDITKRKQAEEEMILAKNRAEESDRLKSAFLQNISHEIRTPMNSIIGFLEILEDPGFSRNEKKMYANIVNKNGQRLLNTIHDIIEISKIMTSNIELNPTRVEINSFILERFYNFKPFIEEKGLVFTLNCKIPVDTTLMIDEAKLDAVLSKILDNANKFTTEGSIDLSVHLEGDSFVFVVKDTGVGIEPKKLSAVFQPFYQADHDFNRKHEGAGLGLSISKAYVEMLGGKIWIESSEDTGTTVSFTIPSA